WKGRPRRRSRPGRQPKRERACALAVQASSLEAPAQKLQPRSFCAVAEGAVYACFGAAARSPYHCATTAASAVPAAAPVTTNSAAVPNTPSAIPNITRPRVSRLASTGAPKMPVASRRPAYPPYSKAGSCPMTRKSTNPTAAPVTAIFLFRHMTSSFQLPRWRCALWLCSGAAREKRPEIRAPAVGAVGCGRKLSGGGDDARYAHPLRENARASRPPRRDFAIRIPSRRNFQGTALALTGGMG